MNLKTKTSSSVCSPTLSCSTKQDQDATIDDLSGLLASINVAIVIIDANFRVRYFTPAACNLIGMVSTDLGHPFGNLACKIGDERIVDDAREVLEVFGAREAELRDGYGRFWSRRIQPYRIIDNRVDRMVVSFTDITDRKRLDELQRAQDESKNCFLTDVSHELRTPLAGILLWSKLLAEPDKLHHEELQEGLEAIKKCAEEQQILLDGLVEISRMATGEIRLEKNEIEVVPLVRSVVSVVKLSATAKGVIVEEHYDETVGMVRADSQRLHQVIWNLLTNAVKFTGHGGWIGVRVNRYDDALEIRVADSGQGIDGAALPHIFERFRSAEGSNSIRKCGLSKGLYAARRLVELHDGTITADSAGPGLGATFLVRLPLPAVAKRIHVPKRFLKENEPDLTTRCAIAASRTAKTITINEQFYYNGKVA